jgi:hypothetical protein
MAHVHTALPVYSFSCTSFHRCYILSSPVLCTSKVPYSPPPTVSRPPFPLPPSSSPHPPSSFLLLHLRVQVFEAVFVNHCLYSPTAPTAHPPNKCIAPATKDTRIMVSKCVPWGVSVSTSASCVLAQPSY